MPAHVLNGRFQILLRRRQNQAIYPLPDGPFINVIVQCDPLTGAAQYIPGTVDNTAPFPVDDVPGQAVVVTPVDGWYDFSNWIEGDEKLSFTWDKTNSGDSKNSTVSQDGSNYDKGITSDLVFFDAAWSFVNKWLLATECQILNCVEVKIIDLVARANSADPAGNYRLFEIKSDNVEYAPVDEPCQLHVRLREQDGIWHCIHKTVIWDDWQGWFNSKGTSTFQHPAFLTCIEPRPRLVNSARMALLEFLYAGLDMTFFNSVDWLPFLTNIKDEARNILNADRFVDAPQIKTYIQNVAMKCNMTWDTIFDEGQDWEFLCLYYPQSGQMYENQDDFISPSQAFIYDNRWLITLADLMDKLKVVFAAEWYVTPLNKIIFKYKKDLLQLAPIYDYTAVGAEPIYGLRYTFNGEKKPAYGTYQYATDGSDLASQEIDTLYSDIVNFERGSDNPMLEGDLTKNFEFAATGFIRDGRAKDYLKLLIVDGKVGAWILLIIIAAISLPFVPFFGLGAVILLAASFWAGFVGRRATELLNEFVREPNVGGAVRLTSEQVMTPRLLLWDGVNIQKAMVEKRVALPIPNPYYNPPTTDYPGGVPYDVKNAIGQDNPPADSGESRSVYNYPMYIDGDYYGNLFQYHDPIDNPLKSIETHQNAKFCVDLCEAQLNLYGVFQDQYAQIGKIVKVEARPGYDVYVRVGNINVDYASNMICISGNVIRHPSTSVDEETPGATPPVVSSGSELPPVEPTDVCFKWLNDGTDDATVIYKDCFGNILTDVVIAPQGTFCAIEILGVVGGHIVATDSCVPEEDQSGSASAGTSGGPVTNPNCHVYINMRAGGSENISYIDCDGNLIAGVSIPFMLTFCALEIVTPGCSSLIDIGECLPCEDCCLPEFISASTSSEPPPPPESGSVPPESGSVPPESGSGESGSGSGSCVPIGSFDFILPAAIYCDVDPVYEYRQALDTFGATPPFEIVTTDIPSWMSITVDPDTNEIVFTGTPDLSFGYGFRNVFFNILNCCPGSGESGDCAGLQEVGTFIETVNGVDAGTDKLIIAPATDAALSDASTVFTGGTYLWTTDGDGTFDDATLLNPTYTIGAGDIANGFATLTLTVSGSDSSCPDVSDTVVVRYSNTNITAVVTILSDGYTLGFLGQVGTQVASGVDVVVDWGDGSPLESFPYVAGTVIAQHTYALATSYGIVFYYTKPFAAVASFFIFDNDAGYDLTTIVPTNLGSATTLLLNNILDLDTLFGFITGLPTGLFSVTLRGSANSTETTADFLGAGNWPNTQSMEISNFPALTQITNVPVLSAAAPNQLNTISLFNNPSLTDMDSASTWKPVSFTIGSNNAAVVLPTLDLTVCNHFIVQSQSLTTTEVNTYLIALDANGITGGVVSTLFQTPAAPPSGAGATAKANLIGKGWTVNTD